MIICDKKTRFSGILAKIGKDLKNKNIDYISILSILNIVVCDCLY